MTVRGEVFADSQLAVETRMLEHDAQPSPHCARIAGQVVTEEARAAGLNGSQRREQFEQRGLAAAVGSKETENLASCDREGYVTERLAIAVAKAQGARFDRGGHDSDGVGLGLSWIRNCRSSHISKALV